MVHATSLPSKSLCGFRIITGIFLLFFATPNFLWLNEVPKIFFNPPIFSLAYFANDFPSIIWLFVFNLLLILSSFNIILGIKTRASTFVYLLSFIVLSSFQFSFGKVDHVSLLLLAMLFCLAFSEWGRDLALVPDKALNSDFNIKSLSLLSVLICFSFFSAGFEKALHWINFDFSTSGSAAWYYKQQRAYLLGPYVPGIFPFWAFKILDFIAVAFELSPFIFLLIGPKAWRLWLISACIFHLCNTLFFNILFNPFAIAYLAFADSSTFYDWLKRKADTTFMLTTLLMITVVLIYRIYLLTTNCHAANLFLSDNDSEGTLYFAIGIWILSISMLLFTLRKTKHMQFLPN